MVSRVKSHLLQFEKYFSKLPKYGLVIQCAMSISKPQYYAGVFEKYSWRPGIIHPGSAIWMLIWKPQKYSQKHIFLKEILWKTIKFDIP